MRIKHFVAAVILSLAFIAPAAFAEQQPLQLDAVRSQQAEIRAGALNRTGRYKDMSASDRDQLLTKQAQVLRIIEGKQTSNDLNEEQRVDVFNSLELIEALVNKADDERVVCERRATLGSNRKTRVCMTVAQMREAHERAREDMNRSDIQTSR